MQFETEDINQLLQTLKASKNIKRRRLINYTSLVVFLILYVMQILSLTEMVQYSAAIAVPLTLWNYIDDSNEKSNLRRIITLGLVVIILAFLGDFGAFLHYD